MENDDESILEKFKSFTGNKQLEKVIFTYIMTVHVVYSNILFVCMSHFFSDGFKSETRVVRFDTHSLY